MYRRTKYAPMSERLNPKHRPFVIVAEDDEEMRTLLRMTLSAAGCDVCECNDGAELVAALDSRAAVGDLDAIDLVVSDIRMPNVTGLEALRNSSQHMGAPPTILITGFGDSNTIEQAIESGADAVFDKPFDLGLLLIRAQELIRDRRGRTSPWTDFDF